jgi:hypothetical protein
MHAGIDKFNEVNDVASKLDDQIRKLTEGLFMLSGVKKPSNDLTLTESSKSRDRPQPGREDQNFLYVKEGATATSLVNDIPIAETSEHVQTILQEIERDYPELQDDIWNAQGETSGRAISVARQRPESKILQRRPNYDNPLVRAQQMAIAIAGERGYGEGEFNGFGLDSFDAGDLDHRIGPRPVFATSAELQIETDKRFWETAKLAVDSGLTIEAYLETQGWDEDTINRVLRRQSRRNVLELRRQARQSREADNLLESGEVQEETSSTQETSEQELRELNE